MNILIVHNDMDISHAQPVDCCGRTSCVNDVAAAISDLGHDPTLLLADEVLPPGIIKLKESIDMVFNLADEGHCARPEMEGHIPAILDMLRIPYTGAGVQSIISCLDKIFTNLILEQHGISTPKSKLVPMYEEIAKEGAFWTFPLFVKPRTQDGSIGINNNSVVNSYEELSKQVSYVHEKFECDALVQEFIDGEEYNVGILGRRPAVEILSVSRLLFDLPGELPKILTYDSKWNEKSVEFNNITVDYFGHIDPELREKLERCALKAYNALQLQDYGRVDFRVARGIPYVIDVNPNPDLSPDAGLANMALAQGLSYHQLVNRIIDSSRRVLERR